MNILMKILKTVIALLLLLVLVITIFIITRPDDIPPFDDSDLRFTSVDLPTEQNAFFVYKEAAEKVPIDHEVTDSIETPKKWNDNLAETWIKQNQEVIDLAIKGNKREGYRPPIFSRADSSSLTEIGEWLAEIVPRHLKFRNISKLFCIKSIYDLRNGEVDKGYNAILHALKFAQKTSSNPSGFLDLLFTKVNMGMTYEYIKTITSSGLFTNNKLLVIQNELENHQKTSQIFKKALSREYATVSIFCDAIVNIGFDEAIILLEMDNVKFNENYFILDFYKKLKIILVDKYLYLPNKTKQDFALCISSIINDKSKNYKEFLSSNVESCHPFDMDSFKKKWNLISDNFIGKKMMSVYNPKYLRGLKQSFADKSTRSKTITMLALYRYRNDHGNFPDSIEVLVPDYLSKIPIDYFDGKPLRYSKEKEIIYSVGYDLIDSGGNFQGQKDDKVVFLNRSKFPNKN